jgi:toxin ParE1/3/4
MTRSFHVTLEAEDDIRGADHWYEAQRMGLGDEFSAAVIDVFHRIEANPPAAAVRKLGVRRMNLKRFPYGVHYIVDEEHISVIAVLHAKRDPNTWMERV